MDGAVFGRHLRKALGAAVVTANIGLRRASWGAAVFLASAEYRRMWQSAFTSAIVVASSRQRRVRQSQSRKEHGTAGCRSRRGKRRAVSHPQLVAPGETSESSRPTPLFIPYCDLRSRHKFLTSSLLPPLYETTNTPVSLNILEFALHPLILRGLTATSFQL